MILLKKAIVELVDDEDKEHPLSDNQILKKTRGIRITLFTSCYCQV